jgi:hypothetical protein
VKVDASGQETVRAPTGQLSTGLLPDGGVPPLVAPAHAGPLVDARGTVAFASLDGRVGTLSPDGAVEMVVDRPCSAGFGSRSTGIAGITPHGRGAFVVTCDRGSIVKIAGPDAETAPPKAKGEKPARKPPSSTAPRGREPAREPQREPQEPPDLDEDPD